MSTRIPNTIFAAALTALAFAAASVPARAQTNTQGPSRPSRRVAADQPQQSPRNDPAVENADLAITARVTARELRFEKVPNAKVEFTGRPRRETLWETERENLPEQVQPGVTYRDIGIRLRITSVFADIDRIVAEALGEKPATDDPQPQRGPRPQSEPPQSTPPGQAEDIPTQETTATSFDSPRQSDAAPARPSTSTSPAKTPPTDKATRQRRGAARKGRGR